jgi:hypothetical protein
MVGTDMLILLFGLGNWVGDHPLLRCLGVDIPAIS